MDIVKSAELPFWDYVGEAFKAEKVPEVFEVRAYITFLLCRFLRQDSAEILEQPLLVNLYEASTKINDETMQHIRLIADASLFTAGTIAPYTRKSMGVRHCVRVGECAYEILFLHSKEGEDFFDVYRIFQKDLRPYVKMLSYLARNHIFEIVEGIVTVYERYLTTGGSEEDRKFLRDHGVII